MISFLQKKNLSAYLLAILLAGLLWSRALLSLTLLFWALIAIYLVIKSDKSFLRTPIFIWSICPMIFWLLGAWQDPFGKSNYDYLLTLTAYPATILILHISPKKLVEDLWIKIWLSATVIALLYPLFWYLKDYNFANNAYGRGQSLPTFMDTDHVRFSIFLCSSLLFILFAPIFSKKYKHIFTAILLIIILFLSVRTGWILAIMIVSIYAITLYVKSQQKNIPIIIFGATLIFLLTAVAYFSFPTMQQKIAYSIWEWNQFKPGDYDVNYSDGTRRNINYVSWKIIQSDYSVNTGWQAVSTAVKSSFSKYFKVTELEFGWPFNQWLYWWIGSGWWGMILFTIWLFYPIAMGSGKKDYAIISWTLAIAFSSLVETTLNYQFGVLLHILPLAIIFKLSSISKDDNL